MNKTRTTKYLLLILIIHLSFISFSQNDKIWYDNFWNHSDNNSGDNYLTPPEFKDGKYTFKFYNKKGQVEMIAESFNKKPNFRKSEFINFTKYDTIYQDNYKLTATVNLQGTEDWKLYKNGLLFVESHFKNNHPYGNWKLYYENNTHLRKEFIYEEYYECYSLIEEVVHENIYNLPERFTSVVTHLIDESHRILDGCLDGIYKEYNKEGIIKTEGNFKKGAPIGIWNYYVPVHKKYNFSDFSHQQLDKIVIKPIKYNEDFNDTYQTSERHFEIIANIKKDNENEYFLSYLWIDKILMKYFIDSKIDKNQIIRHLYKEISEIEQLKEISFDEFNKTMNLEFSYYYYQN